MLAIEAHEDGLRAELERGLAGLPDVVVHSRAARRTPTLLFTLTGRPSAQVADALAEQRVNAPMGSFYAQEASRLLALEDRGIRVGIAPYTDGRRRDPPARWTARAARPELRLAGRRTRRTRSSLFCPRPSPGSRARMTEADPIQPNAEKDPDDWVTGEEPATGPQLSYLSTLAQQAGQDVLRKAPPRPTRRR